MAEPRTEAGRRLLDSMFPDMRPGENGGVELPGFRWDEYDRIGESILAIEAEAQDTAASSGLRSEPSLRDALAAALDLHKCAISSTRRRPCDARCTDAIIAALPGLSLSAQPSEP